MPLQQGSGGLCREMPECFLIPVDDRSSRALAPAIRQDVLREHRRHEPVARICSVPSDSYAHESRAQMRNGQEGTIVSAFNCSALRKNFIAVQSCLHGIGTSGSLPSFNAYIHS
ncbi:hypothetical protein M513_13477 [Trichuris suis]|uniref:Uncharacterized protein n=1 Tax=Trichuris suis TaxID=68888 RepID=A0A085LKZ6_9BILA|nr:hypothetical protein M513_13477 [Trichuris suis]